MEDASSTRRKPLIVGLGNPGEQYRATRHNLGFRVLDRLAESLRKPRSLECNAAVVFDDEVTLVWPQTFMNRSGFAVRCLFEKHDFSTDDLLVVYDDSAIDFGTLRLRGKGGPGGHRGMESIIRNLRTDRLARLRLGISPPGLEPSGEDLSDFVLSRFDEHEQDAVDEMIQRASAACRCWLDEGIETAMNRFNG